jgi:alanyl-tRNA synthetase
MQSEEIRKRFLAFFEKRGHTILPSASLVPENDPSVLFNTAGMQPLVPYLLGQKHPSGTRLVNIQKCVRTGDLDDIGDNRHFSFFEMMGNWSLGDYFKKEAISWSYEFLTSKEEGLGLNPTQLYVTVFLGDENAPLDTESIEIWKSLGIPAERIYALPVDDNWWSPGDNGPCGPCTEMFYDVTGTVGNLNKEEFINAVKKEDVIEIWNDVFMEYEKKEGKVIGKLAQRNVDTGAGLERITAVMQGKKTAYETDLFKDIMDIFHGNPEAKIKDEKAFRIIADHLRASFFIISEGVLPSNEGRGYVLRRLIRRMVRYMDVLQLNTSTLTSLSLAIVSPYIVRYPEIVSNAGNISNVIKAEEEKFRKTLTNGLKEFEKATKYFSIDDNNYLDIGDGQRLITEKVLSGKVIFDLYTTHGFPIELIREIANEKNIDIDEAGFNEEFKKHQKLSQTASAGMFKGGLANHNEKTIRLHTAHHLLLSALQQVLGKEVKQRGSNITEERLRIDFAFDRKMTDDEKQKVESIVNGLISQDLEVIRKEMPREEAEKIGAEMEFGAKYPEMVSVYMIIDKDGNPISKEFCGGPHVSRTGELGSFKIQKEEASSQGVRRVKAILS